MLSLVSIIIPFYNAEQYIAEALYSALEQTYGDLEIIVVDDGSTDASLEIVKQYKDNRIKILSQRNKGGSSARNNAIEAAMGEYIKFLDADDVLLPDAIEKQIEQSKEINEHEIVFGDFNFMNRKGGVTSSNTFHETEALLNDPGTFFLQNWKILITCPLHKKEYLLRIGGFDEKLPFGQESDLHFRLALDGVRFNYRPARIFNYRSHSDDSRISSKRVKKDRDLWALVYSLDKKIQLLEELNGKLNKPQQEYFSRSYFGLARKSFMQGNRAEGKYFLARSKQYAGNRLPPFRQGPAWAMAYQLGGNALGFVNLEKMIRHIRGRRSQGSSELDILFEQ